MRIKYKNNQRQHERQCNRWRISIFNSQVLEHIYNTDLMLGDIITTCKTLILIVRHLIAQRTKGDPYFIISCGCRMRGANDVTSARRSILSLTSLLNFWHIKIISIVQCEIKIENKYNKF